MNHLSNKLNPCCSKESTSWCGCRAKGTWTTSKATDVPSTKLCPKSQSWAWLSVKYLTEREAAACSNTAASQRRGRSYEASPGSVGQLASYESTREKEQSAERLRVHGVREGQGISTVAVTAENTGKMSTICGGPVIYGEDSLSRLQLCFHVETVS